MTRDTAPRLLLVPLRPALIHGVAQRLPVLVRVQAPDAPPAERAARKPYRLSLVIDRSGSMSGTPLEEAVRCARHIVDRLAPTDCVSLVTFDDRVQLMYPLAEVGDGSALRTALAAIRSGGSTNLHGGWKAGADTLIEAGAGDGAAIARVLLLSDGVANVGELTETDEIAALCAGAAARGVSTSTYGLGRGFNESLMVEMGKRGAGNHYYGDTAADLFEPFAEEFDLISNLYARGVRLSLVAPAGVQIRLLNDYPVEAREGFPLVRLPDVPFGAEAWAIVELEIPASMSVESAVMLLQAAVSAATPDGVPIAIPDATLALAPMPADAWNALVEDPLARARLAELEAGRFLDDARRAAANGDWVAVQRMIVDARTRFAGNPWVSEVLEGMEALARDMDQARFVKESAYNVRKMSSRVSAKDELLRPMVSESAAPSYLRRKKMQGKAEFERRPGEGNR